MSVFAGGSKGKKVPKKEQLRQQTETTFIGSKVAALKTIFEHVGLYIGLACYTAIGAKVCFESKCDWLLRCYPDHLLQVFQLLENPHELEKLETNQALLVTSREEFIISIRYGMKKQLVKLSYVTCAFVSNMQIQIKIGPYIPKHMFSLSFCIVMWAEMKLTISTGIELQRQFLYMISCFFVAQNRHPAKWLWGDTEPGHDSRDQHYQSKLSN